MTFLSPAKNLSEKIRRHRRLLGYPQARVAQLVGVSYVHICNIERGFTQPTPELLAKLTEVLHLDRDLVLAIKSGKKLLEVVNEV